MLDLIRAIRGKENLNCMKLNQADLISYLEVIPSIDEDESGLHFILVRNGLRLELSVFVSSGDVYISIYQADSNNRIVQLRITACAGINYVQDKRGEYLDIGHSQNVRETFCGQPLTPYSARLSIRPSIQLLIPAEG